MERYKPNIRLPATFVCSMTDAEALNRIAAAKRHPGVAFTLESTTSDKKIVGRTVVTDLSALDKFNEEVFPESTNKSSRGRRRSSP